MQKDAEAVARAEHAQIRAEGDEMIVMHPHEIASVQPRIHFLGEAAIDPPIALAPSRSKAGQVEPVMMDWPEGGVAEAKIVLAIVAFGHRHGDLHQPAISPGSAADLAFICYEVSAPSKPEGLTIMEGVEKAYSKSLGRTPIRRRRPVGHDHKALHHLFSFP